MNYLMLIPLNSANVYGGVAVFAGYYCFSVCTSVYDGEFQIRIHGNKL